ncbi:MAG: aspartate kinase [Deltaproteobacteria bacterium]|nr:aspartate kinase [Deltaproteobacteria bacterium]
MVPKQPNVPKVIVQKFGGTSVGTIERIRNVAKWMLATQAQGYQVVGVVSAMSGDTNRLVDLATQLNPQPWSKEYDMLLASGEQVSVALLTLAINSIGGKARGLLGHQLGILTDSVYSSARIKQIDTNIIQAELGRGVIPIVAGFQGVDVENNITTLGRGGSDTSAVAIAAALQEKGVVVDCEIYTDVDGVYTTDPRICAKARKLDTITYEEMMELAGLGAKVLQIRSVELAAKYQVPLHVRSSFDPVEGTRVVSEGPVLEQVVVSGVAADMNDAKVTIMNLSDRPGLAFEVFEPLAKASVVVDVIVQASATDKDGGLSLSFTCPKLDLPRATEIVETQLRPKFPKMQITSESNLAKVSVVGVGMRHHPGVAAKMFGVLSEAGITIKLISTSEIKITVLVDADKAKLAVERLHSAFDLDKIS